MAPRFIRVLKPLHHNKLAVQGGVNLDLLAVPKYPYAAMENWGLSVFVEQKILLDPEVSSFSYQMDLTMVLVHEICHQWLGDLVTPMWWDDVWIKEGFAHYFEFVGSDFLFPKWNMVTGQTKSGSKPLWKLKQGLLRRTDWCHWGPTLEPGLGLGHAGEHLVAESLPVGLGRAQPEGKT
ncbi:hypothetical protein QTP70_000827 [Hemibagrus guttatus]|uniref:Peptidase M1 membrane alanine aminopeptidase domain-containing protein n=1 Tax=Hemibagrus guttatus TaxID=175788 RepID=A0AAE0QAQ3_9TELE|nr:hypothetical protein QTP70_000827 [Hemibagrus guttatus]